MKVSHILHEEDMPDNTSSTDASDMSDLTNPSDNNSLTGVNNDVDFFAWYRKLRGIKESFALTEAGFDSLLKKAISATKDTIKNTNKPQQNMYNLSGKAGGQVQNAVAEKIASFGYGNAAKVFKVMTLNELDAVILGDVNSKIDGKLFKNNSSLLGIINKKEKDLIDSGKLNLPNFSKLLQVYTAADNPEAYIKNNEAIINDDKFFDYAKGVNLSNLVNIIVYDEKVLNSELTDNDRRQTVINALVNNDARSIKRTLGANAHVNKGLKPSVDDVVNYYKELSDEDKKSFMKVTKESQK